MELLNMNTLIALCLVAFSSIALADRPEDLYDIVDIQEILDNEEMTRDAYACLMDSGPCGEYYQHIRDKLPLLLKSKCKTCTPEHKAKYDSYMAQFKKKHIKQFKEMVAKFS